MHNRLSLLLSFALVLICPNLLAQLELGTHFMRDLVQSSKSNPAFFVQDEISIPLPSFYGGFFNDNFKAGEVLTHEDNLFTLNLQQLDNASESNGVHFQNNLQIETFGINYQHDNWRIDLSQSFQFINEFSSSAQTSSFLLRGNAAFVDQEITLEAKNDLLLYNELALGFAYRLIPGINFGARVKYLSGIANMKTETTSLKVITNSSDFSIESQGSYLINTAGLYESNGDELQGIKDFNLGNSFFGTNNGFGFDFGLDFEVNNALQLAASIKNVGSITWTEQTRQFSSSGNKTYNSSIPAINGDVGINFSTISDSLQQVLGFTDEAQEYTSKLPMSIYLSGLYKTVQNINVGFLYGYASFADNKAHYASLHIDKKFGKYLRLGTQYSYQFEAHHALGFNAILNVKGVQVYFQTDNVLPVFDILDSKYYNLRCGINVGLNSKSKKNLNKLSEEQNEESKEEITLEEPQNKKSEANLKKLNAAQEKERKKQLKANDKLVQAALKERRKAEAKKAKEDKAKVVESIMTEPILPDVKENDTKTSEKQKEDIATVPEQEIIETTIPTTTTVENQNALNNEAELQRRKEASEQRAIEESLRKQRETEARLLAEAKRREEARMTEEANKRNQTTYVQEQKVTTPSVTNSITTLGKKKLTDKTSLRQTADSKSSVLKRFAPGDVVTVLEKTNVYWWKVEFKGQIGWVKARLLE